MFEIRFTIAAVAWPALERLLEALGALAITEADGDHAVFDEPGLGSNDQWQRFSVEALFDSSAEQDAILSAIASQYDGLELSARPVAEQAWTEVWKERWQPQLFDGGLCVCPSWCDVPGGIEQLIRLDPGQAFGTGTHNSTALCLNWLAAAAPLGGARVIDYGCGSAILALAARCFGAAHVDACDIDPVALTVARDNVVLNAADGEIEVSDPDTLGNGTADILLANILLEPLLALEARFAGLLKPGGRIVLAGLLASQAATAGAAYAEHFELDDAVVDGEWALISGTRR